MLPGDVLIADRSNSRLLIIDPRGRVVWQFPQPGDRQALPLPDDAFFSPNGRQIVATEEDVAAVKVIDVATRRIVYRYGQIGVPGPGPNHLSNPDDAMLLPNGSIVLADIKNCRLLLLRPPAHRPAQSLGSPARGCYHDPPFAWGSPNGAFPLKGGGALVTEINGDWVDALSPVGRVLWSTHPPGVYYPSDSNQVRAGPMSRLAIKTRGSSRRSTGQGACVGATNHVPAIPRSTSLRSPSLFRTATSFSTTISTTA